MKIISSTHFGKTFRTENKVLLVLSYSFCTVIKDIDGKVESINVNYPETVTEFTSKMEEVLGNDTQFTWYEEDYNIYEIAAMLYK